MAQDSGDLIRADRQEVARNDRYRELLLELKDYPPAHSWSRETIELWVRLHEEPPGRDVEIPGDIWPLVRDDVLATTGHTPWTKVNTEQTLRIMFAGRWITPAIRTYAQECLTAPEAAGKDLRCISIRIWQKSVGSDGLAQDSAERGE